MIWFDLILFYSLLLFSIVSHTNEWFVSVCLSVHPSFCLSDCLFICMNKFMFSRFFLFLFFLLLLLWYYLDAMTIHWIMIVIVIVIVIAIICNEYMYISSCLVLSCLALTCFVLSCVEWTSITIVIIGMTLYELVLHDIIISYHILSYVFLFYLFCWFDLHSILFYFISNRFDMIWFDSILFYWIWFTILFSIVSHINEWFMSIFPSVRLSVCRSVYLYE